MKTLTIEPKMYTTGLRMKGLSIKSAGYAGHDLILDESGYFIENGFQTDPRTAKISVAKLSEYLAELYQELPFDRIKINGNYQITGEQLMELIIKKTK